MKTTEEVLIWMNERVAQAEEDDAKICANDFEPSPDRAIINILTDLAEYIHAD